MNNRVSTPPFPPRTNIGHSFETLVQTCRGHSEAVRVVSNIATRILMNMKQMSNNLFDTYTLSPLILIISRLDTFVHMKT